jgi:hypothetical protein
MKKMEVAIALTSILISIIGGGVGGLASIIKLSRQLDRRFDETDAKIQELSHRYDVQHERDLAQLKMLNYQLGQTDKKADHKYQRFENSIRQVYKYLENNHSYNPPHVFPVEFKEHD